MIGVDWGTTSFRAWRFAVGGTVLDQRAAPRGLLSVTGRAFDAVLREECGAWLAAGETRVLLAGMVGSRTGWVEAPYLPCPASIEALASALTRIPFEGADVRLVPGLSAYDAEGVPEAMRGEETQIAGLGIAEGLVCLPGSHSKWARLEAGRITGFETWFSGEAFAALRSATILGQTMPDAPADFAAFDRGLARAGEAGHLLHHLFGARTLALTGALAPQAGASYLSGLLIGHETRAAISPGAHVTIVADSELSALYARAVAAFGATPTLGPTDAASRGLARIGALAWP